MIPLNRGLGVVLLMALPACSSDSKSAGTTTTEAGANTGGSSVTSGGATGMGGASNANGGTSNAGGGSGTGQSGGRTSAGGTSGSGGAGGAGGAGGKAGTGGGSAVQASADCVKYCDCMSANCADKVVPGGCLASCAAQKNWDLPCRQNMCNLAPAQPNNDHCTHALGVGECLDK